MGARQRETTPIARVTASQVHANRSALGAESSMAGHRERLTAAILEHAPSGGSGRLCLLGAGNANDVDLSRLLAGFREVHLADIDGQALGRAVARLTDAERARVHLHAPLDLSGMFDDFETWTASSGRFGLNADERTAAVRAAARRVSSQLPGPFDTVVSCCILTQIQLSLLELLGDRDPAFPVLRAALNAIHIRTLAALIGPRGTGLLVTDMTSSATYPLDTLPPGADLAKLFDELLAAGNLIYVSHPGLLSAEVRRDPELSADLAVRFPIGPWLWQNGPDLTYLVYALELTRKS